MGTPSLHEDSAPWILFLSDGEDSCVSARKREIDTTAQQNKKPVHKHHPFGWWVVASLLDSWALRFHSTMVFPSFCPTTSFSTTRKRRGNLANVLRALPIAALQHPSIFLPNEPLNESSYFVESPSPSTGNQRWWKDQGSTILRSSLIGAVVLFLVHPLELARTRLALDIQSPHQFSGICDCLSQIASRVQIGS